MGATSLSPKHAVSSLRRLPTRFACSNYKILPSHAAQVRVRQAFSHFTTQNQASPWKRNRFAPNLRTRNVDTPALTRTLLRRASFHCSRLRDKIVKIQRKANIHMLPETRYVRSSKICAVYVVGASHGRHTLRTTSSFFPVTLFPLLSKQTFE